MDRSEDLDVRLGTRRTAVPVVAAPSPSKRSSASFEELPERAKLADDGFSGRPQYFTDGAGAFFVTDGSAVKYFNGNRWVPTQVEPAMRTRAEARRSTRALIKEAAQRARSRKLVTEIRVALRRRGLLISEADIGALISQALGQEEMDKDDLKKLVADLSYRANIPSDKRNDLARLIVQDQNLSKLVKAKKWDAAQEYAAKKLGQKGADQLGRNEQIADDVENAFEKITAGLIKKYADVVDSDEITAAMNDALAAFASR